MITQNHQQTVDRCLQIITHKLFELSSLLTDADEKTFEELNDIFSDSPFKEGFEPLAEQLQHWKKVVKGRMERIIEKNSRQYLAVWGSWYDGPELHNTNEKDQSIVYFSSFTEDRGYSEEDIKAISELIIGGAPWYSSHGNHFVIRVK